MDNNPAVREEVASMITGGTIPWEEFVWTGSSHFVLPALFTAFERNGLLPFLPADLEEHLRHIHSLNFSRNGQILDQCREINSLLKPTGIEPVFLKGAGFLLSGLYHNMGDRIMEDIDILIAESDLEKAVRCLSEHGYMTDAEMPEDTEYADHHHLPPMICRNRVATVEIHRTPVHREYNRLITAKDVFDHSVRINDKNHIIPAVQDSRLLVFLHEHRSGRGFISTIGSLKGLCDFYLLAKLCQPDPADLPPGRFRKRYIRYGYAAGRMMNRSAGLIARETPALRRYWKRELFLMNHPEVDEVWHAYVYSPAAFLGWLVKAIWSGAARKLVVAKIRKVSNRST
jgi:hypothetical protein